MQIFFSAVSAYDDGNTPVDDVRASPGVLRLADDSCGSEKGSKAMKRVRTSSDPPVSGWDVQVALITGAVAVGDSEPAPYDPGL